MQRTIKSLFNDYLPGQDLFLDLVELALVGNGVVVSHRPVGLCAKVSIPIEGALGSDMNIGLAGRNDPKPPVVLR